MDINNLTRNVDITVMCKDLIQVSFNAEINYGTYNEDELIDNFVKNDLFYTSEKKMNSLVEVIYIKNVLEFY